MYKINITPGVQNTDGLGHINNGVLTGWFETARTPIYKIFVPSLDFSHETWNLIMVHSEYDFLNQIFFNKDVEIHTYIKKIGNSSFTVYHELYQNNIKCSSGEVVLVYYDYINNKSMKIPDDIKETLLKHFYIKK